MSIQITALYERLSRDDEMQGESNSDQPHTFICSIPLSRQAEGKDHEQRAGKAICYRFAVS